MKVLKYLFPFLIIIILSYFAIKPFFVSGFFSMHDDTQVARIFEMHKALVDGQFPVRWVSDLGYNFGYPIFNFYAPFAYYFGGFLTFIFDALIATKIMMVVGIILSGIFMYLLAKQFWGAGGGLISSLLYLYIPYHAVDIYVRGDVAEFWAYAFIPLAFYGLWMAYKKRTWVYVVIGSLGYAGLITSHNLTALMITPFLFIFSVYLLFIAYKRKQSKVYYPVIVLLIGILLSAFYWLPVFAEMKYTNVLSQVGGGADYKDHFVCPIQLWSSQWGFGGSTPTCVDGLSFKIGKLHVILFVISIFAIFLLRKSEKSKFGFAILAIISSLFAVFLMLEPSKFVWDAISQMAFFQYPWRFLLIVSFFISFLGGIIALLINKFVKNNYFFYILVGIILTSIIYFNAALFIPQTIYKNTVDSYTNKDALRWTTSKISDEYMPKGFQKPKNFKETPENKINSKSGVTIISIKQKTQIISIDIKADEKTDIIINNAYFPAWHVFIDGKKSDFKYFNRGLIVTIPKGEHIIEVRYSQTWVEIIANIVSLTGVIIIVIGIIIARKKYKYAK